MIMKNPNLMWKDHKILIFFKDSIENYEKAKYSDWNCFILDETFDIEEFKACFNRR